MSVQVQRRRGTAAQHASFVGAAGEITVDTTNNRLILHDGVTTGGIPSAKLSDLTGTTYSLDDLTDVDVTSAAPVNGDGLTYNGTTWVPAAVTVADSSVSNAKLANMAEGTIKGRPVGAGTGEPVDLTTEQVAAIAGSNGGYLPGAPILITTSGTFAKADYATARAFRIEVQAGGGGGGGAATTDGAPGAGGGSGGYTEAVLLASALAASETITVGAGGAGGASSGANGASGGNSSFGALVTANGGGGGSGRSAASDSLGGAGGTAGASSGSGVLLGGGNPGQNGLGGALSGGGGGSPQLGGGGAPRGTAGAGNGAQARGAGGGGALRSGSNFAGGDGGDGYVRVTPLY
jgi:hypothetical protein